VEKTFKRKERETQAGQNAQRKQAPPPERAAQASANESTSGATTLTDSTGDAMTLTETGTGGYFTYYFLQDNFSVAATGNAAGMVIRRLDYTPGGDFALVVLHKSENRSQHTENAVFPATARRRLCRPSALPSVVGRGRRIPGARNDSRTSEMCRTTRDFAGGTVVRSDFDFDTDVDLTDYAFFANCYNGANNPPLPGCQADADLDGDAATPSADRQPCGRT
jgi:hypothetical protein